MELKIEQEQFSYNFRYNIYDSQDLIYTAVANRTSLVPRLRGISLLDRNGLEIYTLVQEDKWKFILSNIPLLSWFNRNVCPFTLYKNSQKQGLFKQVIRMWGRKECAIGYVDEKEYSIYQQTGNEFTIFSNGIQIGLVTRRAWKEWDGDSYKILFDKELDTGLAALIALFIDILWYTADTSTKALSWEYTFIFNELDRNKDWKPKD